MSCSICLEPRGVGPWFQASGCTHGNHWDCISARIPMPCSVCRRQWDPNDEDLAHCFRRRFGTARLPRSFSTMAHSRQPLSTPLDMLPICCQQRGPPPDFEKLRNRCMSYGPVSRGTVVDDHWDCLVCGNDISRDALTTLLANGQQTDRRYCFGHGRLCAHVVDCRISGWPIVIGQACVAVHGTSLTISDACPSPQIEYETIEYHFVAPPSPQASLLPIVISSQSPPANQIAFLPSQTSTQPARRPRQPGSSVFNTQDELSIRDAHVEDPMATDAPQSLDLSSQSSDDRPLGWALQGLSPELIAASQEQNRIRFLHRQIRIHGVG